MVRLLAGARRGVVIDHGVVGDDSRQRRPLKGSRATCSCVGGSMGPRDTSSPPSRPKASRECCMAHPDQARQAAVVRPPRRHARVRAARATRCRRIVCFCVFIEPALRRAARRGRRAPAARARPPDRRPARASDGRTTFLTSRAAPRRRRRARGDADRAPGLAHDRRARRERRLRGRARGGRRDAGRRAGRRARASASASRPSPRRSGAAPA